MFLFLLSFQTLEVKDFLSTTVKGEYIESTKAQRVLEPLVPDVALSHLELITVTHFVT